MLGSLGCPRSKGSDDCSSSKRGSRRVEDEVKVRLDRASGYDPDAPNESPQPSRKVSSGSRRAALIDGYNPAATETSSARLIHSGMRTYAITTIQCAKAETRYTTPTPKRAP